MPSRGRRRLLTARRPRAGTCRARCCARAWPTPADLAAALVVEDQLEPRIRMPTDLLRCLTAWLEIGILIGLGLLAKATASGVQVDVVGATQHPGQGPDLAAALDSLHRPDRAPGRARGAAGLHQPVSQARGGDSHRAHSRGVAAALQCRPAAERADRASCSHRHARSVPNRAGCLPDGDRDGWPRSAGAPGSGWRSASTA